jgi:cell wall-associated NlpC family hydrolase
MPIHRTTTLPGHWRPTPAPTNDATRGASSPPGPQALHADGFISGAFNFVSDIAGFAANAAATAVGLGSAPAARKSRTVDEFVEHLSSQVGTRYRLGGKAASSDDDPKVIDCSGLVRWAALRAGGHLPDGSWHQMRAMRRLTVDDAVKTRGALLYKPGHIAVSLGNGLAIEAQPDLGVAMLPAVGRGWTHGGKVPGLDYS